jgi:hypothetical protein
MTSQLNGLLFRMALALLIYTLALGATSDPDQEPLVPKPDEDHGLVVRSGEEDPRVFFFVPSVWTFITDPNSSAFFLLLVTFQVIVIGDEKMFYKDSYFVM